MCLSSWIIIWILPVAEIGTFDYRHWFLLQNKYWQSLSHSWEQCLQTEGLTRRCQALTGIRGYANSDSIDTLLQINLCFLPHLSVPATDSHPELLPLLVALDQWKEGCLKLIFLPGLILIKSSVHPCSSLNPALLLCLFHQGWVAIGARGTAQMGLWLTTTCGPISVPHWSFLTSSQSFQPATACSEQHIYPWQHNWALICPVSVFQHRKGAMTCHDMAFQVFRILQNEKPSRNHSFHCCDQYCSIMAIANCKWTSCLS